MSWILEVAAKAIEEEAFKRANTVFDPSSIRVLGLNVQQIAAFAHFFEATFGERPQELDSKVIVQKLRERFS